jgi:organic hydroperoxide reductase OsmC/OhrA
LAASAAGPNILSVTDGCEALMTAANIAHAMQRVRAVFTRRPEAALHADEPASAHWQQGLRVLARHANGTQLTTDMPSELGGQGIEVTPGWLLRAALASCLATRIAMECAAREIALTRLEVVAASRSDVRGLFGMVGQAGERIAPEPREVQLRVRIAASNVAADGLQAMIEESHRCSPVSSAIERPVAVSLHVQVDPS